jgi:cyclic-di-GMP-binding protein
MPAFDVVSQVDLQEVDNAVNQARKEIGQRYDFKGTNTEVEVEGAEIRVVSTDDYKVKAAVEVIESKLVRRGISLKSVLRGEVEPAAGGRARQKLDIQRGISTDKGKAIVKRIKDAKLKVQAQIQDDQVRVSGKNRDDLQAVIQLLKDADLGLPLQFVNMRD